MSRKKVAVVPLEERLRVVLATKYCLAVTISRTGRGPDAVVCLRKAIAEAERLCGDLRDDRGLMDIVDADGQAIGQAPAPIAIVSDNGSCFRGDVFTHELAEQNGNDPLLRHVRTRVKSPQTNGVVERFFGTLKYEHLYRCEIPDGDALAVETNLFRQTYNTIRPHQDLRDRSPMGRYASGSAR